MLKKSAVRSVLKLIGRKRSRSKFMLTCRTNSSSTQNQFRFAKDYGKMYSPTFFFAMYYGPQLSSVTSPKMVCVQNTEAPDNQNNFLNHNVEEQLWRSPQLQFIEPKLKQSNQNWPFSIIWNSRKNYNVRQTWMLTSFVSFAIEPVLSGVNHES